MSYTHLAGRLIETQRSMLGQPAIDIAQSVEGLTVTDDGNVTGIDGDERAVVGVLADRYARMLGTAAEARLRTAAEEFADELLLPPALGGPEDADDDAETDAPADRTAPVSTAAEPAEPAADTAQAVEPSDGETTDGETTDENGAGPPVLLTHDELEDADPPAGGTVLVEYQPLTDFDGIDPEKRDLGSVYLVRSIEADWMVPISVEDAIIDAVAGATDLGREDLDEVAAYVDSEQVLSVLGTGSGVSSSFEVEDHTVRVFASGTVRIH
jgi:hypothetical protein